MSNFPIFRHAFSFIGAIALTSALLSSSAYPQTNIPDKKSIESLFLKTYPNEIEIDDSWVNDIERDVNANKRLFLIGDAADQGLDLEFLREYGLTKIGKNQYEIDISENLGWMSVYDLFARLSRPRFLDRHKEALKSRGFSDADLIIFENYINRNNIVQKINTAKINFLDNRLNHYKSQFLDPDIENLPMYEALRFEFLNNIDSAKRSWAIGLYNSFDTKAKRILVSYAMENLGKIGIAANNEFFSRMNEYIAHVTSGKWESELRKAIRTEEENKQ